MSDAGPDHRARDRADNAAFRARAREGYRQGGWARDAGSGSARTAVDELLRRMQADRRTGREGAPSAIPADLVRKAVVVGSSATATQRVRGDPFVTPEHCRLTQLRVEGSELDRSVWVERMEQARSCGGVVRVRRGDGSGEAVVDVEPVRIFPGDTLVVGHTELPWRGQA